MLDHQHLTMLNSLLFIVRIIECLKTGSFFIIDLSKIDLIDCSKYQFDLKA